MKLKFYMKSGNSLVAKRVKEYKFEHTKGGTVITFLRIAYSKFTKKKLIIESIDLSQIEAISII